MGPGPFRYFFIFDAMATIFHYDSRDHHQPFTRGKRFWLFVMVISLLIFALNFSHLYYAEWSPADATPSRRWWLVGALFCGMMALAGVALVVTKWARGAHPEYQMLTLDDTAIHWDFGLQSKGRIALGEIVELRMDPRHLIVNTKEGQEIWIENYLLRDPEKWGEFIRALRTVKEVKV